MGVSTYCVMWLLWLCRTNQIPRGAIYWLPTYSLMKDFVNTKVDPVIRDNYQLAQAAGNNKDTYNLGLKYLFGTPTMWRGLESKAGVKSISADAAIYDEFDEADMSQVKQARERLSASSIKLERELSVPTIPDYGINARFLETDQCHWAYRCRHCSTWNILEDRFPHCFEQDKDGNWYRSCQNCHMDLDGSHAQWVKKNARTARGYQISQLYSPFITPNQLMQEYQTTEFMGHFYSHKLGLPYLSSTDRVTSEQILQMCDPSRPVLGSSISPTCMGIDVGSKLHVVILQRVNQQYRLLRACELDDFSQLDNLTKSYNVRSAVIDAMPETRKSREFVQRIRPKGFICFYSMHQKGDFSWNEETQQVSVNRTESLDIGTQAFINQDIFLPRRDPDIEEFAQHCANVAKVAEENKDTGSKTYVYKRIGPDHYRHALNYAIIAASRLSNVSFSSVFR